MILTLCRVDRVGGTPRTQRGILVRGEVLHALHGHAVLDKPDKCSSVRSKGKCIRRHPMVAKEVVQRLVALEVAQWSNMLDVYWKIFHSPAESQRLDPTVLDSSEYSARGTSCM